MQAERGGQQRRRARTRFLDEAHIFVDAGPRACGAIAIGHLVAQGGPQPGRLDRAGDDVQAAVDLAGAGVMVDQGRGAVADGVHQADQRAVQHAVVVQRPVERPPQAVQDLGEVLGRWARDVQPASERAVEMRMRADIARHQQLAAGVLAYGLRILRK